MPKTDEIIATMIFEWNLFPIFQVSFTLGQKRKAEIEGWPQVKMKIQITARRFVVLSNGNNKNGNGFIKVRNSRLQLFFPLILLWCWWRTYMIAKKLGHKLVGLVASVLNKLLVRNMVPVILLSSYIDSQWQTKARLNIS